MHCRQVGTVPQKLSNDPFIHYIKILFFLCISKMYKQTARRVFIFHHQNYNTIFTILPKEFGKEKFMQSTIYEKLSKTHIQIFIFWFFSLTLEECQLNGAGAS